VTAGPQLHRLSLKVSDVWCGVKSFLPVLLLPPVAVLIAGYLIWLGRQCCGADGFMTATGLGRAKTKTDLVVMASGRQILIYSLVALNG
jgi:hypothetical protein